MPKYKNSNSTFWVIFKHCENVSSKKENRNYLGLKSENCKRHLVIKPNFDDFSHSENYLWRVSDVKPSKQKWQKHQKNVWELFDCYLPIAWHLVLLVLLLCNNNYAGVQKSVRQAAFFSLNMLLHIYHVTSALGKLNIVGIGRNLLAITLPSHGN